MYKHLNKFLFVLAAIGTSNLVHFVYEINTAFAAMPTCGTATSTIYSNSTCTGNNSQTGTGGSQCGTNWRDLCKQNGAGWQCDGYVAANYGYCNCSSLSNYTLYPSVSSGACGRWSECNGSAFDIVCNTSVGTNGSAGYMGTQGCICCPTMNIGRGSIAIAAKPGAMAASDCYVVGVIGDETGLYEYTDADRCFYAS